MLRPSQLLFLLAACGLSLASGCCCSPCLRLPCIQSLDRHYPGSDDCNNGGPCGDPEDVGGMQTGMANCETCASQRQLTGGGCSSCSGCGDSWFPWTKGFTGGGCGRFYFDEWWSDPPCKCEPCDLNGNYCGGQGICRSWRLGLPMPMLSRNCAQRCGPGNCCGSALSRWRASRTCWDGCLSLCGRGCGGCESCSSGQCHIDSVGYNAADDATCSSCQSGGTTIMTPTPPTTPAAPTPVPVPVPAEAKTTSTQSVQPARTMVATRMPTKAAPSMRNFTPAKVSTTRMATKPSSQTSSRRG